MKMHNYLISAVVLMASLTAGAAATDPAFDADLLSIQQAWAKANYETPRETRARRRSTRSRSAPRLSRSSIPVARKR